MEFSELVFKSSIKPTDFVLGNTEVENITDDTRKMRSRSLYICMPSKTSTTSTSEYIMDAVGSSGCIVHDEEGVGLARKYKIPYAYISKSEDYIKYISDITNYFYNYPSKRLKLIGVTGTNGKTSISWMIKEVLNILGTNTSYTGTLGFHSKVINYAIPNTTPYPAEYLKALNISEKLKMKVVVSEVSSHALQERRLWGSQFDIGIFNNLTPEHLDFHGSMEDYAESKKLLFTELASQSKKLFTGIFNLDDKFGAQWSAELNLPRKLTYGKGKGDVQGFLVEAAIDFTIISVKYKDQTEIIKIPLAGEFQLENALAAISACLSLGYNLKKIAQALPQIAPVPGRFQTVENGKGIKVIVDYAHTPDALEKVLQSAANLSEGKIFTVFGCGGNRDAEKRPLMGKVAAQFSEKVYITTDNPRSEDPAAIAEEIKKGMDALSNVEIELDRERAIYNAIEEAKLGDVVVIAGKGIEKMQIGKESKSYAGDIETAMQCLS